MLFTYISAKPSTRPCVNCALRRCLDERILVGLGVWQGSLDLTRRYGVLELPCWTPGRDETETQPSLVRLFWLWQINPFGKCEQLLIPVSSLLTPFFQHVMKAATSVNKE